MEITEKKSEGLSLHRTVSHSVQFGQAIATAQDKLKPKLAAIKKHTDDFRKKKDGYINSKRDIEKRKEQIHNKFMKDLSDILTGNKTFSEEKFNATLKNEANSEFFGKTDMTTYVPKQVSELSSSTVGELWYRCLGDLKPIACFIFKKDKNLLKFLKEVRTRSLQGNSFELVFEFSPNNFFSSPNVTITVNVTSKGRLRRVDSTGITWLNQEHEKKYFSDTSLSFFRIFKTVNNRVKGLFNLRDVGRAFFYIKKVMLKYFAACALGVKVPAVEAVNARAINFPAFDKELDPLASRVEATRKEEQMRESHFGGLGGGFGGFGGGRRGYGGGDRYGGGGGYGGYGF
jgi:hypothetical protein